ncbi:MAG: Histidinol phosphatase [uncultured bacterium]|nr:MAG: Histidinol phosphatase [uncultured bacterium]OFW69046.1 MAG: hypothetical protein A2X70_00655 [Alphaproteobacteria bacterium GWC2_42_16]OFW82223.1 MAG: hypothetical protein A3E50_04575 [Alphaproteobacteria bacterium RIFCSPHIGHO2_12_FULL_42_100]OFW86464.1 MAG: hypothetical protein A2W06_00370 [Alphaproteobacteria bacterium RBG_16_42_14]OFW91389.1 MAG: hypothetical protein A3C41_06865 [Alphaproteobacteria bacterium RIFCSPHIGHO2_02_FULL_42_30]OFW93717.1 MAG: hypothetical protein A2W46_010
MTKRALFLDRDGVINRALIREGKPYAPINLEEFFLIEGVEEALITSKKLGFLNIIVTNQPDVSTGKQSLTTLNQIHDFIKRSLPIDDIFVCLHSNAEKCSCRKPSPGMLFAAQKKWNLNLEKSFLVGDRWRDVGAAQAGNCPCFFIDYGYKEQKPKLPYTRVSSLKEAVQLIYKLEETKSESKS